MRPALIRYTLFALLFFGGLWFAKTLQSGNQKIITLTDNDAGKTLTIKKGQLFTLTLPDHVDGGYRFDTIQFNPVIITLQKHMGNPPPPNSPPGRSGTDTWQFIAKEAGQTIIKVTATRPWQGGGTVAIFENKVLVK